ncbi:MAG: hypothetical protein A2046_06140 [Bacteroidetes bacterium GWA2_30_7]|nr:MAG: hypothetical protein A2046_06140 [Bacteroidetes bacterium GWA2_30_7]
MTNTKKNETKERKKNKDNSLANKLENNMLILHNDEVNTFEYVIDILIKVCGHNTEQAEQCAYITHYKGKCDIKKGSFEYLKVYKDDLINKGLNVTID